MTTHWSPRGRLIDYLEGDPEAIVARGQQISDLGEAMAESAHWLEKIKDEASEQQGKAIDTLRETIKDSGATLKKAVDLYEPVGPVLKSYGEQLEGLQVTINELVDECRDLAADVPAVVPPEGDDDPEAEQGRQAHADWQDKAELFDTAYDEWEDAFEKAANGITDEMAGTIEDGGWREFWDIVGKVLEVAGLIVAVLAIVIGGPALFWIALVVGILALTVTITQASYGDKDGGDIALAALGAIPFGKAGTALAKVASKAAPPARLTGKAVFGAKASTVPAPSKLTEMAHRTFAGKDSGDFATDVLKLKSSGWRPDRLGATINELGGYAEAGIKLYTGSLAVGSWVS